MIECNIIAFGNDHTNTLGIVQSIGNAGKKCNAVIFGKKKGVVASSKFIGHCIYSNSPQDGINLILENFIITKIGPTVIIGCCDDAGLYLDKNKKKLNKAGFLFQQSFGEHNLSYWQNKHIQTEVAKESGFNIPFSTIIEKTKDIPSTLEYPVITKPLISSIGSKSDIKVINDKQSLETEIDEILSHTPKVLLQKFIKKDFDYTIMGCALKDGNAYIPIIFKKTLICPANTGLEVKGIIEVLPNDSDISNAVKRFISTIKYVGLFSIEVMHNIEDDKFYFIEANLRNDGCSPMAVKAGINLPWIHCLNLLDISIPETNFSKLPLKGIWDNHHLSSLFHGYISLTSWIKDLFEKDVFLFFSWTDPKPTIKLITNMFKNHI